MRIQLCVCLMLLAQGLALAADGLISSSAPGWPQWRGPRRDGVCDETGLLQSWPAGGPEQLWQRHDIGTGWASPIVVDGRVFIAGDVGKEAVIFALDEATGDILWTAPNGKAWTGSYPGARAACAWLDGRIYHMNAHGRVACLDAADGAQIWSADVATMFEGKTTAWGYSECVLVDGEHVIVTPGGSKALAAALSRRDGTVAWTTPPLPDSHASHSSPILIEHAGRRVVVNCSSAHGFAVDADTGKLLWTVPLKNTHGVNAATPVYGGGDLFFVTPYAERGRLYRLDPASPAAQPRHIWTSPIDSVTGGAVLAQGVLYAAGYRAPKSWFAIDWATGETRAELEELTTGAALWADNRLYCLDETGQVALVAPGPDKLETVGRFRLVGKKTNDAWTHPVIHNGRLYLRYHENLRCYDIRPPQ